MKIAAGQIDGFLHRPDPQIRAVLLYGPDAGLVRERADTLAKTICPELHDPFRVAELTGAVLAADPARLVDEAAQISLMGGRRVVRLRVGELDPAAFSGIKRQLFQLGSGQEPVAP